MYALFRPPVGMLTASEITALEWGLGISSGLSVVCSFLVIAYIVTKFVLQHHRRRHPLHLSEAPHSGEIQRMMKSDFLAASSVSTSRSAHEADVWLLLWFSELVVLSLMAADLGSALW